MHTVTHGGYNECVCVCVTAKREYSELQNEITRLNQDVARYLIRPFA